MSRLVEAIRQRGAVRLGRARGELRTVGHEGALVLVIDDFAEQPQALVAAAAGCDFRPEGVFPGVRARLPKAYLDGVRAFAPELARAFGLPLRAVEIQLEAFSIVSTPHGQLPPIARTPHVDTANPRQLAIIHYLCPGDHGGLSFYRHAPTGWESLAGERLAAFRTQVEPLASGLPADYPDGDAGEFVRTATIEGGFNRAVIFQGAVLHSGDILRKELSPDPRQGRLTATTFLTLA